MDKTTTVSRVRIKEKRRPRDIDAYTPLKPAEVAWALRKYARELQRKYRDKGIDPTPTHSILIRACMRGALDCLALASLIKGVPAAPHVTAHINAVRATTEDLIRQNAGIERAKEQAADVKARADAGWQTAAEALLIKK